MTTYTTPHSLPIIEPGVDKIKDANEVSALAGDINALATSTNTALESVGATASDNLAAAIADVIAGRYKNAIVIPDGTDLNTLKTPGIYYVRLYTSAATITNRPPSVAAGPFMMEVLATPFGYTAQNFYGYSNGDSAGFFSRVPGSITSGTWAPWMRLDNDTVAALGQYAGAANKVRRDDFSYRRGGTKFTNGLGAVALRFDHGLTNLKSNILPLLRARSLPFAVAINSRNWALSENSGATQADVQGWVTNDKAEVWNHAADHNDASNPQEIYDRIVTGLAELKAQIPNASIDGYFIPGVDGTGYMGFNIGETPEVFYQTAAGRLILENHSVVDGGFPGTAYRVLDGTIRQGQGHYTIEAQTVAGIKARIDTVIASKQGLQIMLHPSLLNNPGYLTTAQLAEVLDYIKAQQTAGTLAVLSPYDLLLADSVTATSARTSALEAAKVTVANTAGRTAYAWDAVNNRQQLIYGDTGWRSIPLAPGVTTGQILVRRNLNRVSVRLVGVMPISTSRNIGAAPPSGFMPSDGGVPGSNFVTGLVIAGASITSDWHRIDVYRFAIQWQGDIRTGWNTVPAEALGGQIDYLTDDPWPTSLPGSAVGSIPA